MSNVTQLQMVSSLLIEQHLESSDKRWHENIFKEKVGPILLWSGDSKGIWHILPGVGMSFWLDRTWTRRIVWVENQTGPASFTFSLTQTHACTICPAWVLLSDTHTHKRHCWLNSHSVLPDSNFGIKVETIADEFTEATTGMFGWESVFCLCTRYLLKSDANIHFTASFCHLLVSF